MKIAEALVKYAGLDNYRKPKADYINRLYGMTDDELSKECETKIWLSAYASNNPRSDYHWHCDACYDAAKDRDEQAAIYSNAYDKITRSI